jgi:hypothetical protein
MDVINEMFCRNAWGWGHLLLSVLVTSVLWRILYYNRATIWGLPRSELRSYLWKKRIFWFFIMLVVVIGWEVWEYWWESARLGLTPEHIYGTWAHYWYDTAGDIILGIIGYCIGVI